MFLAPWRLPEPPTVPVDLTVQYPATYNDRPRDSGVPRTPKDHLSGPIASADTLQFACIRMILPGPSTDT